LSRRRRSRIAGLTLVFGASLLRCANPTDIRVAVHSEVTCDKQAQVALVGGSSIEQLGSAPSSASTQCMEAGDGTMLMGDVVLAPLSSNTEQVAFAVMTRPDGQPPDSCIDPANAASCIVARRQLHFSPRDELSVRVDLRLSCLGVVCPGDQTCVRGQCAGADVPAGCGNPCDEGVLLPAAADAGPPDATPDAPTDATPDALTDASDAASRHFLPGAIVAGASHTCAITPAGGVECWGSNGNGQLGDGTTLQRVHPVAVQGLQSVVVTALAAGQSFTCALATSGAILCWGDNVYGELGDGTTTERHTAVPVPSLSQSVTAIAAGSAGSSHACALRGGKVLCWGSDAYGQLGDGATKNSPQPIPVVGLSGASAIGAGTTHTCAVTAAGGVVCWGENDNGQVGNGTSGADVPAPAAVQSLASGAAALSGGIDGMCTLMSAGSLKCWGLNDWGQLGDGATGDGATTSSNSPKDVLGVSSGVAVSFGGKHACALVTSGDVQCWGWNAAGQLGDGTTVSRPNPMNVTSVSGVVAIATGASHGCAMTSPSAIACWGSNANGQLGDGTTSQRTTPVAVAGFP
jgi:alpha-tubulin suppressor-like RCC1 family protein